VIPDFPDAFDVRDDLDFRVEPEEAEATDKSTWSTGVSSIADSTSSNCDFFEADDFDDLDFFEDPEAKDWTSRSSVSSVFVLTSSNLWDFLDSDDLADNFDWADLIDTASEASDAWSSSSSNEKATEFLENFLDARDLEDEFDF
jgi:hypothetical protein